MHNRFARLQLSTNCIQAPFNSDSRPRLRGCTGLEFEFMIHCYRRFHDLTLRNITIQRGYDMAWVALHIPPLRSALHSLPCVIVQLISVRYGACTTLQGCRPCLNNVSQLTYHCTSHLRKTRIHFGPQQIAGTRRGHLRSMRDLESVELNARTSES